MMVLNVSSTAQEEDTVHEAMSQGQQLMCFASNGALVILGYLPYLTS